MEHVNAEILRAIADGKKVQYWKGDFPDGWESFDNNDTFMCWKLLTGSNIYEWRIAPKTIMIGEYEVPEPCREAPEQNTDYWTFTPSLGAVRTYWVGTDRDKLALEGGFVHLTEEAAEKHYEAIKSLLAK